MKKMAIVINNLETGGVQSSLKELLNEIHNKYDVTVIVFYEQSVVQGIVPHDVTKITLKSPFCYLGASQKNLKRHPLHYFLRCFWVAIVKLFGRSFAIKLMLPFQKKYKAFDYAISYLHEAPQNRLDGGCNEFVLKKIEAKKKIAWIHCDFEKVGANNKVSEKIYNQFDEIVACSEGTKQVFLRCMPKFENKCVVVRNCNNFLRIKRLAGEGIKYDKDEFNIVTVARLAAEKGIDRALLSVRECIKRGYKIHYHIVGDGYIKEQLKKITVDYELDNVVTFYGNQRNPYLYIKGADLFLLPSYHEAAPMVFDEAACLGVPVLTTKTTSTDEMIIKTKSGIVCENSQQGITDSLLKILENKKVLEDIRIELGKLKFNNQKIIETLEKDVFN